MIEPCFEASGAILCGPRASVHFGSPLPGVEDAVDYSNGRKHGDYPEHWGHNVEEGADDQQHQTLGAFHETDAAGADERLGAGAGITHHDGADHSQRGQQEIEETVAARVEN